VAKNKELFPKLNETLISKVLVQIKTFPEAYNQNTVADQTDVTKGTPCGAIGCFGGWALLLQYKKEKRHGVAGMDSMNLSKAQKLLGLTEEEGEYLFDTASGNPEKDYQTIIKRLEAIRVARVLVKKIVSAQEELNKLPIPSETYYDETQ
jgi:hypothetical protein